MKTWNFGNTTVRNPERIKSGLRVIKDSFEGKVFDRKAQGELFEALKLAKVIEGDPPQARNKAASGRKWQSVCNKLGLTTRSKRVNGILTLTDAGNKLLSDETVDSDIYLRQMLKVQLPSPTESELEGAALHPFYLVLAVSVELRKRELKGLSKEEIALFIVSATDDNQTDEIVGNIIAYRNKRDKIEGKIGKRRFFIDQRKSKARELYGDSFTEQNAETLSEYSDTAVRYSAITGIFGIGTQSLVIKDDQLNLAKALIEKGPPELLSDEDFLSIFHNPTLPVLPTDDTAFLQTDISSLEAKLGTLSKETGLEVESRAEVKTDSALVLRRRRQDLEQELTSLKEIQFYRAQSKPEQVKDIQALFESIESRETIGGSDYRPAWAEWGVWRTFLSINTIANPVNQTRGFKIDSELFPIHHAKGGAADLCFKYDDNVIVPAEITLVTSERQFNMEGEAVKFHVKSVVEANQSSEVIGVFTAPDIHVATAHEFFGAEFYSEKMGGAVKLSIIPINFEQLQSLLPGQNNSCSSGNELLERLRGLLKLKDVSKDGADWLTLINKALA